MYAASNEEKRDEEQNIWRNNGQNISTFDENYKPNNPGSSTKPMCEWGVGYKERHRLVFRLPFLRDFWGRWNIHLWGENLSVKLVRVPAASNPVAVFSIPKCWGKVLVHFSTTVIPNTPWGALKQGQTRGFSTGQWSTSNRSDVMRVEIFEHTNM